MSASFLRRVDAVAGGRALGRGAVLSSGSVASAGPVAGHRRGAVSQERCFEALLGTGTKGRGR
ncbi:hypothetical protein ACFU9Y_30115 [Streptomyces sp. NPDC057621]|uniref:hypothetical protein n=1 Tax=Streptomyces sp. NPDC057621 TaxID=3346186 RepID=UPI0036C66500